MSVQLFKFIERWEEEELEAKNRKINYCSHEDYDEDRINDAEIECMIVNAEKRDTT